jgi:hypothetical protein
MISQQKNRYYKTLGPTLINSPMSSPSLRKSCNLFILNITKQVRGSILFYWQSYSKIHFAWPPVCQSVTLWGNIIFLAPIQERQLKFSEIELVKIIHISIKFHLDLHFGWGARFLDFLISMIHILHIFTKLYSGLFIYCGARLIPRFSCHNIFLKVYMILLLCFFMTLLYS